jgi:uncharacterized protein YcnI
MKKLIITLALVLTASAAFAHTALMSCFKENDGTITCEAGFSDGSSSTGSKFRVEKDGKVIYESTFDANSEVNFKQPEGNFQAIYDAGSGHKVTVQSKDIN